ncbi:helix-turn-helix domain-containing protein [Ureibacillus chungkukjangi]|uniref:HNH endonuclease n=1 Tax=Ureibacillus chungkukjangi TaxID=1202712 RepID=A0A318TE54_9BACL|nr:helix-turn-helix transcriptional regulator [Ureibacillus chungkukjangi]MCM3389227.1 helix-turn-helix domain-containing protein [Ureibacillus chungkukjangi]PYF02077.1 HNH endonuclease [Ureibacillus chungkukjangi]
MNALGEKIMISRKVKGLSLRELGNRIGMSHSQLSRVERGVSNPSNSLLKKIADELELKVEELLLLNNPDSLIIETKDINLKNKIKSISIRRYEVFVRDNFICQACGLSAPSTQLIVANIIPFSLGGESTIENSITLCSDCHIGRNNHLSKFGLEDDVFVKRFNIDINDFID